MAEQEAPACTPLPEPLKSLWQSLDGDASRSWTCLCYDGVLRSLSSDGAVMDAIGLSEKQIAHLHTVFPLPEGFNKFNGVDGTTVPTERWMNPAKDLLPAPMSEEGRMKLSQWQQENPDVVTAQREKLKHARAAARRNIREDPGLYGRVAYEKEMRRAELPFDKAAN
ncbi:hypothetical protein EJ08DRAFT_738866 [Tothia fuscella]|uniref:Uncharacterized protein n=1 Tax=Tothia fuscella TaxID=1048955 RepID=A0A9P4NFI9_9PEZI|nr:hypothetical protein EJ08DRAFT_738866 [Tothia fuscella]